MVGVVERYMERQTEIFDLMCRLGVTANYIGFFYMAYAVQLCMEQPERLSLVTKWVYPDVAKRYKTNWRAVERDIRTVGCVIWAHNRPLLESLAHGSLPRKPCTSQLLAILSHSLLSSSAPLRPAVRAEPLSKSAVEI